MLTMAKETRTEKESDAEAVIHGDVLEAILTHVPLIDLVPACHVSKPWKLAVSASLRHSNPLKPWLLLHTQATRPPYSTSTHAYDPRSNLWLHIHHEPSINYVSSLRSSQSSFLYMISPSKFSFSFDPLHLTWHHMDAPLSWRTDPVVALVDRRVVIAGGTCEFEDDPVAVEVFDLNTRSWETCESMPAFLRDCCATSALSIATTSERMYVVEKRSGVCFWFDPRAKSWRGPYNLHCSGNCCSYSIGYSNDRLILIGVDVDDEGEIKSVKLYGLDDESLEVCGEIGEMPEKLVKEILNRDKVYVTPSISVNVMGNFAYIINNLVPDEVFVCEIGGGDGGACKWWSVRNVMVDDACRLSKRLVFSCSDVDLSVLQRAMGGGGKNFAVKVAS